MSNLSDKFLSRRVRERTGIALVAVSVSVLLLTFFPVIREEVVYQLRPPLADVRVLSRAEAASVKTPVIVPIDEDFGIIIPKIGANARVIADVDWQDATVYQKALTKGVAQAQGTAHPGEWGNMFLFAHSGVDFFEMARYNAIFSLMDKLQPGDSITLFYRKQRFDYRVTDKKTVAPEAVQYLTGDPRRKTLTLMTCWPAGTTLKRLIVNATEIATE